MAALVVDSGYDLEAALRRVARDHGINLQQLRPSVEALRSAIHDYRELFRPQQLSQLTEKRRVALNAMQLFAVFEPRLSGALVHGDGPLDRVRLLLMSDTPERVMMFLSDRHMPWRDAEASLHYSGGRRIARPALRFLAGPTEIELVILDPRTRSDPPRDPVSGGPLETLGLDQLAVLLGDSAG